jgi:hypothetical protein
MVTSKYHKDTAIFHRQIKLGKVWDCRIKFCFLKVFGMSEQFLYSFCARIQSYVLCFVA